MTLITAGPLKRSIIDMQLRTILFANRTYQSYKDCKPMTPLEFEQLLKRYKEWSHGISQRWQRSGIEGLICPISVTGTANKFRNSDTLSIMNQYATLWNLLNFPAGTIPVTKVYQNEENYKDDFNDNWTNGLENDVKGS